MTINPVSHFCSFHEWLINSVLIRREQMGMNNALLLPERRFKWQLTVTSASKENIICIAFSSESPLLCIIQADRCVSTNHDSGI